MCHLLLLDEVVLWYNFERLRFRGVSQNCTDVWTRRIFQTVYGCKKMRISKFWVSKQDLIGRKLWDATSSRPSSLDSTQFLQWTVSYWLVRTRSGVRTNFHQRARTLNSNKVSQITHPHVFSSYESIEWQTFSHTKCHNGLVFDHNNTNDLTVYIFI